jgi:hypothetical protein
MYGPEPAGKWSSIVAADDRQHQFLVAGQRYRVIRPFTDFDRDLHPIGEEWIFLGCSFVPYHDGMSFFVSLDGVQEWQIRLQWVPEEQSEILDKLATYLEASGTAS